MSAKLPRGAAYVRAHTEDPRSFPLFDRRCPHQWDAFAASVREVFFRVGPGAVESSPWSAPGEPVGPVIARGRVARVDWVGNAPALVIDANPSTLDDRFSLARRFLRVRRPDAAWLDSACTVRAWDAFEVTRLLWVSDGGGGLPGRIERFVHWAELLAGEPFHGVNQRPETSLSAFVGRACTAFCRGSEPVDPRGHYCVHIGGQLWPWILHVDHVGAFNRWRQAAVVDAANLAAHGDAAARGFFLGVAGPSDLVVAERVRADRARLDRLEKNVAHARVLLERWERRKARATTWVKNLRRKLAARERALAAFEPSAKKEEP